MHTRISYADPLLELLDCIEDAVQLLAFDYFGAAGNELRSAQRLLAGRLADWRDADAELARLWLQEAMLPTGAAGSRQRRCHCAGALWRARRAIRRHWLKRLGLSWDPYAAPLTAPAGECTGSGPLATLACRIGEAGESEKRRSVCCDDTSARSEGKH